MIGPAKRLLAQMAPLRSRQTSRSTARDSPLLCVGNSRPARVRSQALASRTRITAVGLPYPTR